MFRLNGQPLALDVPFTDADGTQYPSNWLRLASPEDRARVGITEEADEQPFDQRYYYGRDNNGALLPRPLEQVKTMRISEVKAQAYSLLLQTDWRIIRAIETLPTGDEPTDEALAAERQLIRSNSNEAEAAINACTTVDELAALPMAQLAPPAEPQA